MSMRSITLLFALLFSASLFTAVTPAQEPADSDGDGVNNYLENRDKTDPNSANSHNSLSRGLVAFYPF